MSFFVSSLFVPDAERAIVLAWRGMFLTRTEISRFFFMLKKIIPTILHTKERRRRLGCVPKHLMHMRNIGHVPVSNFAISIYYVASNFEITVNSVGGSFAARWARMVLKRCSSERGEREKRFYRDGKDERRRTAF